MPNEEYGNKGRDTELILSPGVFAFVQDNTKGQVNTYCGPYKTSLSNTDQLVTFDVGTKRFIPSRDQQQAIQTNKIVPKGSYVVLENPSHNGKQPEAGKVETLPIGFLKMGQIENLPGPASFPLWPGQLATVIKGHHLRSNQYLMVRVYDDEAAKANWDKSVVKPTEISGGAVKPAEGEPQPNTNNKNNVLGIDKDNLVTGQLIVIKGTDVAFYIPPTGIEVLLEDNNYVRSAETLERLEYSILLDESGNKSYKRGPDVVFPTPTQQFYTKDGNRKFRAFELQPTTGIHIKVIADYLEEDHAERRAGDELFITGTDTPIYYPREEHAIISYGGSERSFAVAIPAGEGRYVLDRLRGDINLVMGPAMFLPDPRIEVVVRKILSDTESDLYYPGNAEVKRINQERREELEEGGEPALAAADFLETKMRSRSFASTSYLAAADVPRAAGKGVVADAMNRGTTHTPPRTLTLNTKYDGAIRIDVWSGFAVQVVDSKGTRRTVAGPQTVLLQYDEYLERLSLSKGKPKNSDNRMNTAYLRYISNPVSDIISLKTQDLVSVDIQVKYLVRFEEANKNSWFSVDNYVQYMVDHLRSLIGNTVRNIGVQEFYTNATNILRDTVLGEKPHSVTEENGVPTEGVRPLHHFVENGMTVYDLELIAITVRDNDVAKLLSDSRQQTLIDAIELERAQQKLVLTKGKEEANRAIDTELGTSKRMKDELALDDTKRAAILMLEKANNENTFNQTKKQGEQDVAEISKMTSALLRDTRKADQDLQETYAEAQLVRQVKLEMELAQAQKTKMQAVSGSLVEAIVSLAQVGQFEKIAEHLAPLSIVRGESLAGTLQQMFAGTPLEGMVQNISNLSKVKATVHSS